MPARPCCGQESRALDHRRSSRRIRIRAAAAFLRTPCAKAGATRRWGIDFESRYQINGWLFADHDPSYADPRFRRTGEVIPLAPTLLMNGGLTGEFANGFSAALRVRYLDDRPAIEDRSLTARGYTLLDVIATYRWHNIEASLALLNLTDTDWRKAQFADTSCARGETGAGNCLAQPGKQGTHDDPPPDIHFTPGNPFAVRAGERGSVPEHRGRGRA